MSLLDEHPVPIAFYGDDFTGSVDVMESLTTNGVPATLFLTPPTHADIAAHAGTRAIGVAGIARTMSPAAMDAELRPIFRQLQALRTPLVHYKICSTFDSSPAVGSIGKAGQLMRDVFGPAAIPVVVGVPELRRYTAFGNLFATADGTTYRLDRHPTMSVHPMTPMHESDLRLHLSRQSAGQVGLIDVNTVLAPQDCLDAEIDRAMRGPAEMFLIDNLNAETGLAIGRQLDRLGRENWAATGTGMALIGSSGIEYALSQYWCPPPASDTNQPMARTGPTIVVAGSRAPATAAQTRYAVGAGFADVEVDPVAVTRPDSAARTRAQAVKKALSALTRRKHVVIYTPPASDGAAVDGTDLAVQLGLIARNLAQETKFHRLVVAGGDTSGLVSRALGIRSIKVIRVLDRGAPVCRASSSLRAVDQVQVCLKGGQLGGPDYFARIADI